MDSSTTIEANRVEVTAGLGALGDPVRLATVGVLAAEEQCVCRFLSEGAQEVKG